MKNKRYIAVVDFETDGTDCQTCNPVQVAAQILDPRSLEVVGEFESAMKPPNIDDEDYFKQNASTISWHAKLGSITPENVVATWKKNPDTKVVWNNFFQFISKYHTRQNNQGSFTSPIMSGYNIIGFDLPIANRLCKQYGFVDTRGRSKMFSSVNQLDVYHLIFWWFENLNEPNKLSMDSMREFFGISSDNAHDAMGDVRDTVLILKRFLEFHRRIGSVEKFKDSFK